MQTNTGLICEFYSRTAHISLLLPDPHSVKAETSVSTSLSSRLFICLTELLSSHFCKTSYHHDRIEFC